MKRTKASQKKIKMLFILIILLAILSITATYAWFSTQRDVEITGMRLNVEVAESMQISLDGETWVQAIEIANMRQFYGTYAGTLAGGGTPHQAKKHSDPGGNANYVPTELLPVSTDGTVTNGKLQFVQGTIIGKSLTEISKCNEDSILTTNDVAAKEGTSGANNVHHPYLVFDMYLRNVSAKADNETDTLILNKGSHVWTADTSPTDEGPSVQNTGLEYSARVGFILYDNTYKITDGDDTDAGGNVTKTIGQKMRELTTGSTNKVAIWEPNDHHHTQYVVNNDARITALDQVFTTCPILNTVTAGSTITDVTSTTDSTNLKVADFTTMKPTYSLTETTDDKGTPGDTSDDETIPAGTTITQNIIYTDGTTMGLKANTMSKVRVYIWLEGQDPDCIDLASTGGKLDIDLKFTKAATEKTPITYTGNGVPTP